jgi:iron complex transport system permease protein
MTTRAATGTAGWLSRLMGAAGRDWTVRRPAPLVCLALGGLLLALAVVVSVGYGTAAIAPGEVVAALTAFDGSREHLIIRTVRLPRALLAVGVGAGLAVAGAVMQVLTRNPLAAPGILGVNAGAAALVVAGLFVLRLSSLTAYVWLALLGAALAGGLVYLLGSLGRGGMTPVKLTLAGAALTSLLASLTQAVLTLNERSLDEMRFWLAGSVTGRDLALVLQGLPFLAAGLLIALLLGRALTVLSLGEEVARGLGQRTGRVKLAAAVSVVLLAGGAVALAGPIGFVGLVAPHLARGLAGRDYRWVLPNAAVLGALLLVLADIGARLVIPPQEAPVGVMTAVVGAPFFIALALRSSRRERA